MRKISKSETTAFLLRAEKYFSPWRKIPLCAEIIFFLRGDNFVSARRNFRGAKQGEKIQLEKIWNAAAFGLKCS
jgi:hypothetical protein